MMNQEPSTISVVIPAYNSAGTIREALDSVLVQEVEGLEIIVVDDASTDGTSDVVRCWSKTTGTGVRLIRLDQNAGPAGARNKGVEAAFGNWMAFLDADDVCLPNRLRTQVDTAKQYPDASLICGGVACLENDSRAAWVARGEPISNGQDCSVRTLGLLDFMVGNPVATSTVLVRKRAVVDVGGFDESFRGPEDYDLWMRLAARHNLVRMDRPLSMYRAEPGSLSMDDRNFLPQILRVLDKAYGPGGVLHGYRGHRKAMAYQCLCGSWMAMRRGAGVRSWRLYLQSLLLWPFSFQPQKKLRWGRLKLVWLLVRGSAKRVIDSKSCSSDN